MNRVASVGTSPGGVYLKQYIAILKQAAAHTVRETLKMHE